LHERNALFDTTQGSLARASSCCAFERSCGGRVGKQALPNGVTFKRPIVNPNSAKEPGDHKVREEIELEVSDAKALAPSLKAWG